MRRTFTWSVLWFTWHQVHSIEKQWASKLLKGANVGLANVHAMFQCVCMVHLNTHMVCMCTCLTKWQACMAPMHACYSDQLVVFSMYMWVYNQKFVCLQKRYHNIVVVHYYSAFASHDAIKSLALQRLKYLDSAPSPILDFILMWSLQWVLNCSFHLCGEMWSCLCQWAIKKFFYAQCSHIPTL